MSRLFPLQLAILASAVLAFAGCGDEIGDSCSLSSDCSPDGDRVCDTSSFEGYCTIRGCTYDSCPDGSTCVRFFSGTFAGRDCDRDIEDMLDPDDPSKICSLDEICTLEGRCAPRANEERFCMKTCDSSSDCRDGYECRDEAKMMLNGGEPVLAPGSSRSLPKFCAQAPR